MAKNRIVYLLAWVSSVVFFCAYQKWFAWLTLVAVVCLPFFSLLVSLPAICTARLAISLPSAVTMGTPCQVRLNCTSFLSPPPWRCRIAAEKPMTDEVRILRKDWTLPTEHCGAWVCTVEKARVCDYLGLFSFPLRFSGEGTVVVRPTPVAVSEPALDRYLSRAWRPKQGGGFSENHELRQYRAGDNIRQIHWKLSAKTGDLILREPMEPLRGRMLLRLDLNGTPEELDRKMGRLLWLGEMLLEKRFPFEIQALTAGGIESRIVDSSERLNGALDALLTAPCAKTGSVRDRAEAASWQYDIGGGTDEG